MATHKKINELDEAAKRLNSARGAVQNMSYDNFKAGDMYKGLQRDYQQGGQMAMKDTLGQVAKRTGGMASSYATSAANQSYNNYMQGLEDAARSLFNDEYGRAKDQYDIARDEYNIAYGEHRDAIGDEKYNAEQKELSRQNQKRELHDLIISGGTPSREDFTDLTDADWDTITSTATNTISGTNVEAAKDEVYKILEEGGTPTADLLVKAGFLNNASAFSADDDEDGIPDELTGLAKTMWERNINSESRTANVNEIEARIANGEDLTSIAKQMGFDDTDAGWKAATGMSKAEWTEKYNNNEIKGYRYQNTEAGRNEIISALANSPSFSLSDKDRKNFDHIYGDGAYNVLHDEVVNLVEALPDLLLKWKVDAQNSEKMTYDPEYFNDILTDWYYTISKNIPGITQDQLSEIAVAQLPELVDWAANPEKARELIGKTYYNGKWITPEG